ncbi:hypothetical protein [Brevibacillus brevis]|uniref:hypothetical protein n=1 Tax=Brevibacillus brevis TaxID=1393 RepID=UPI001C8D988E|nr:hypothetical protein [Brevibacillus brevis]MBY0088431.1 hypothetical protein [Brevibacillus brevis]
MRKIENDEQLQNSLKWLLEKAKELEHPLLDGPAKAALEAKYDFVSGRVQEYRREQTSQKFPYLQRLDGNTLPLNKAVEQPIEPEPVKGQPMKAVNLSAWLDD